VAFVIGSIRPLRSWHQLTPALFIDNFLLHGAMHLDSLSRMRCTRISRRHCASFLTVELLLSLGLAAAAFASFISFYNSVRLQQSELKHLSAATLCLQSTIEQSRSGRYGTTLELLTWRQDDTGWTTSEQTSGLCTWQLTATNRPERGQLFPFKAEVSWDERGKRRRVTAATQVWMK